MVKIRNRLQQPILIYRGKDLGSPIHLLAGESAVLDPKEVELPQVQALIAAEALECRPHAKDRAAEPHPGRGRRTATGADAEHKRDEHKTEHKTEHPAHVVPAPKKEG